MRRPGRQHASLLALLTVSATALAVGAAVLTTITVDGQMGDWATLLADPFQVGRDGPWGGLPDLDAPVQSTGRDLTTFAWTYDATYFYFYVERVASSSNRQEFYFYLDTDEDGLMETGEPVVGVAWWGNNRRTLVDLYRYNASGAPGDPLADALGRADGWTMPGTITWLRELENVRGGAANGIEMEARVSWADLGVPPATPMRFHVSSSNSSNAPSQIDDNVAGAGGGVGQTRIADVTLDPDRAGTIVPSGDGVLAHTLTNTGQHVDTFDLSWVSAGDFVPTAVAWYLDADGDGKRGPGDPRLTDTDGDGAPDSGALAAGASIEILTVITAPAAVVEGNVATVTSTATSSGVPGVSDDATDTVTVAVPAVTLLKSVDRAAAAPGEELTYSVDYTSSGSVDAYDVVLVDEVPPETVYVVGSAAGAGTLIEFSHDGGLTWDASDALPVTHIRWTVLAPLAPGGGGAVSFRAGVL